jgi:flagellar basal-body rod protein FlgB
MTLGMFDSTTIPVLQEVVNFAQTRHDLLVGNVANLDTPGYRVRDLSVETFQERLRKAIEARDVDDRTRTSAIVRDDPDEAMRRVRESLTSILYHDGSDVGLEQQVAEISKNHYLHNVALSIMNSQFRLLQAAVSERV